MCVSVYMRAHRYYTWRWRLCGCRCERSSGLSWACPCPRVTPTLPRPWRPHLPLLPPPLQVELEEGHRFQLALQQTRAQRACHLLSYLRVNILIGLLVVGAISAIFWATKYSQDNKEVPGS